MSKDRMQASYHSVNFVVSGLFLAAVLSLALTQSPAIKCWHFTADGNVLLHNGSSLSIHPKVTHCVNCSKTTQEIISMVPSLKPSNAVLQKTTTLTSNNSVLFHCFIVSNSTQLIIWGLNSSSENYDYNLSFDVSVTVEPSCVCEDEVKISSSLNPSTSHNTLAAALFTAVTVTLYQ